MSFSSIFRVNGEVVAARLDFQQPVTTVSNDFLQREQLADDRPVLISVPVGETMFTSAIIVHSAHQLEDIVLGGDWFRQYRSYASASKKVSRCYRQPSDVFNLLLGFTNHLFRRIWSWSSTHCWKSSAGYYCRRT